MERWGIFLRGERFRTYNNYKTTMEIALELYEDTGLKCEVRQVSNYEPVLTDKEATEAYIRGINKNI